MYKTASLDTGFVIALLNGKDERHGKALGYYKHFLDNGYLMRISTIVISEYCVKGCIKSLPLDQIIPSPFNAIHAIKTGECASALLEQRSKWVVEKGERVFILNDAKIMAQAEADKSDVYVTFDTDSKRLYDILRSKKLVSFELWDANQPVELRTGKIKFPEEE